MVRGARNRFAIQVGIETPPAEYARRSPFALKLLEGRAVHGVLRQGKLMLKTPVARYMMSTVMLMERMGERMKGTTTENALVKTSIDKMKAYVSFIDVNHEFSDIQDLEAMRHFEYDSTEIDWQFL